MASYTYVDYTDDYDIDARVPSQECGKEPLRKQVKPINMRRIPRRSVKSTGKGWRYGR